MLWLMLADGRDLNLNGQVPRDHHATVLIYSGGEDQGPNF